MYIILSQRKDTPSDYDDILFSIYHFPARYRKQIQTGDIFIYYQGDRRRKEYRYYYGTGQVGRIFSTGPDDWYAELTDCFEFEKTVPIYLLDGYVEQLDYHTVRKSLNPPWQWSIRPLSIRAYKHIIGKVGNLRAVLGGSADDERFSGQQTI